MISQHIIDTLNDDHIQILAENGCDFACSNGIVMKDNYSLPVNRVNHIPFTILPSPIPKKSFEQVVNIQSEINLLMHKLSCDFKFLSESIESVVKADDFMAKLFKIYMETQPFQKQMITLGILRTDYMLDSITDQFKQVEINTIASSFSGVGTRKTKQLYDNILKKLPLKSLAEKIPSNKALENIGKGLVEAWEAYGNTEACIVFFIGEKESNVFDQRALEYEIYENNSDIEVRRVVFNKAVDHLSLSNDCRLFLNGTEVAVTYFRCGYMPEHFPEQKHWDMRLLIEKSRAVKSPSVGHQLVGSKKVQQVLTREGVIEKYISDSKVANEIRSTFVNLYSLDMNEQGEKAVKMAIENPENFVLKPQREGGGNNLYDDELRTKLEEIGKDERRCAYVIMDKIRPATTKNYIVKDHSPKISDVISELGIFGVFISKGENLVSNKQQTGHLLRSKSSVHKDGGVCAGVAVLDSPYLI